MNYTEARPKIKSGDLLAWSHLGWSSWYDIQIQTVRAVTESEYSHVGMAWVVGDRVFVIESVTPVVRIVPLSNLLKDGVYWIPLDTPISDEELAFALSKVGNGRYSKWQAILSQLKKLKIGADDLWECAEFIIECRKRSGVILGNVATPAEVVKAAQSLGKPLYFINN